MPIQSGLRRLVLGIDVIPFMRLARLAVRWEVPTGGGLQRREGRIIFAGSDIA